MKVGRLATQLACTLIGGLVLTGVGSGARAQEARAHTGHHGGGNQSGAFVKIVKEATANSATSKWPSEGLHWRSAASVDPTREQWDCTT